MRNSCLREAAATKSLYNRNPIDLYSSGGRVMNGWDIIFAGAVCVVAGLNYLRLVACAVEVADAAVGSLAERYRRLQEG